MKYILVNVLVCCILPLTGIAAEQTPTTPFPTGLAINGKSLSVTAGAAHQHENFPATFREMYPNTESFVEAICRANGFNSPSECSATKDVAWEAIFPKDIRDVIESQKAVLVLREDLAESQLEAYELRGDIEENQIAISDLERKLLNNDLLRTEDRQLFEAELVRAKDAQQTLQGQYGAMLVLIGERDAKLDLAEQQTTELKNALRAANANHAKAESFGQKVVYGLVIAGVVIMALFIFLRSGSKRVRQQDRLLENAGKKKQIVKNLNDYWFKVKDEPKNGVDGICVILPKESGHHSMKSFRDLFGRKSLWFEVVSRIDEGRPTVRINGWNHDVTLHGSNRALRKALNDETVIKHYRVQHDSNNVAA